MTWECKQIRAVRGNVERRKYGQEEIAEKIVAILRSFSQVRQAHLLDAKGARQGKSRGDYREVPDLAWNKGKRCLGFSKRGENRLCRW